MVAELKGKETKGSKYQTRLERLCREELDVVVNAKRSVGDVTLHVSTNDLTSLVSKCAYFILLETSQGALNRVAL